MNRTAVPTHPYQPDGETDLLGHDRCLDCGLPRSKARHTLPDTRAADAAVAARYEHPED